MINAPKQNQPHQTILRNSDEYGIIRQDLRRVIILNLIYLAAILAVYYTNRSSHYLEKWFGKFLNF